MSIFSYSHIKGGIQCRLVLLTCLLGSKRLYQDKLSTEDLRINAFKRWLEEKELPGETSKYLPPSIRR